MGATKVLVDGRFRHPLKLDGVGALLKIEGKMPIALFVSVVCEVAQIRRIKSG